MFHNSTQLKYWTFTSNEEIEKLRNKVNEIHRRDHCKTHSNLEIKNDDDEFFLTVAEEKTLIQFYEGRLKEFCWHFKPPMPINTIATAIQYVKRLFLRNSVMKFHPRLFILASVWLACKTDEFNVSMDQFTANIAGEEAQKYGEAILAVELILIRELNFHLTIHNPFRPFEGLLIDLKTRYTGLENPEQLRKPVKDFLFRALSTDVTLLYSPSQIALAALLSAASKCNLVIDKYVTQYLLGGMSNDMLTQTRQRIKSIRSIVRRADTKPGDKEVITRIEHKLEQCRNKQADPLTEEYQLMRDSQDAAEDERMSKKWQKEAAKMNQIKNDLLGF